MWYVSVEYYNSYLITSKLFLEKDQLADVHL